MNKHKKTRKNKKLVKKKTFKKRGGRLIISESDLKNTHLCGGKTDRETVAHEVYTATDIPIKLTPDNANTVLQQFRKSSDSWFKFVIFNNDGDLHIYLLKGNHYNKHSVIILHGLLEITESTGEYSDIRKAYNELLEFKSSNPGINNSDITSYPPIINLNRIIESSEIKCLPVITAGSGTLFDNNVLCVNDKSGHYKPEEENLEFAKKIFQEVTGLKISAQIRLKDNIKVYYGNKWKEFTGMCIEKEENA